MLDGFMREQGEEDFEVYNYSNEVTVDIYTTWDTEPEYKTELATGADLKAWLPDGPIVVGPSDQAIIPTGVYIAAPDDVDTNVRMRSGLAYSHGLMLTNGIGTIDSDYRNEIRLIIFNSSKVPYTIEHGDRVGQIVFTPVLKANWNRCESRAELGLTERGLGGFGSTGRK